MIGERLQTLYTHQLEVKWRKNRWRNNLQLIRAVHDKIWVKQQRNSVNSWSILWNCFDSHSKSTLHFFIGEWRKWWFSFFYIFLHTNDDHHSNDVFIRVFFTSITFSLIVRFRQSKTGAESNAKKWM